MLLTVALNECMDTALIATAHISATGIAEIILGLAVIASLLLYLAVDPRREVSRRQFVEGQVERDDVDTRLSKNSD